MSVVYASPPIPPPVAVDPWRGYRVVWEGWDGSSWELSDPASPVFMRKGGVEGLSMPAHQAWTSSSPAVHGQYYRGHVVEPRKVFWPVFVYSDLSSEDWVAVDRAWWRSLHPGAYGTWRVGDRSLSCRFVDDGNHAYDVDPSFRGWASYGVSLVADDPFWRGSPVRRTWAQSEAKGFYAVSPVTFTVATDVVGATAHGLAVGTAVRFRDLVGVTGITADTTYYVAGTVAADSFQVAATSGGAVIDLTGVDGSGFLAVQGAPLLRIASGSQLSSAVMTNEGDVEAWPVWTITGPLTSVTVGVDGRTVQWNVALVASDILVIDTDPTVQSAWKNGVDVTSQLGTADFAPIPAGQDRPLSLAMSGTGSVEASITPRYYRAF